MSDTTQAAAAAETAKRKAVSKRLFLDANGAEVDKIEEAAGARYRLLGGNADGTDRDFDVQVGEPGKLTTMAAVFGLHTKIGNVANTVLNDKDEAGGPADAGEAVAEWLAQVDGGVWAERTGGVGGERIDKDALAGAIIEVMEAAKKIGGEGQMTADDKYTEVRKKLEEDRTYLTNARKVPEVLKAYTARVGKATKTIDDLL